MATKKSNRIDVFANVEFVPDQYRNGEGEIEIKFMTFTAEDGERRFLLTDDYTHAEALAPFDGLYLRDLSIRLWVEPEQQADSDGTRRKRVWGARFGYWNTYKVDLDHAEVMAATLRRILARVRKIEDEWGTDGTAQQAALYLCKAIGIKQLVYGSDVETLHNTGERWQVRSITMLAEKIDTLINPRKRYRVIAEAEPIVPQAIEES